MAEVVDGAQGAQGHRDAASEPSDVQARLHRLEHQFAEIQRLAQFGNWEWEVDSALVTWSDELYRIFGAAPDGPPLTFEAILGRVHPDDRDRVRDAVRGAIAHGASYALDHRLVLSDGDVRWLHSRGDVTTSAHGERKRLYGVVIDVTERKRSEQFLREFIRNASHALGTPAAVIVQAAQILADSTLGIADRKAAMDALTRQSKRLHDLSTNLFDLVALDENAPSVMLGLSMMLTPVQLADKVRRAAATLPPAGRARVNIDIGGDIAVLAEPTELERVFVNLLANAFAYGGPNVLVRASRLPDEVIVEVRDDGSGIPDDYVPNLFMPFARRQAARTGSGLGLAIAHQLMAAFGGAISYRRAEPSGSVFTLRFTVA